MQNLKKSVEVQLGQEITDDDFLQGFELAFNNYERERKNKKWLQNH